MSGRGQDPAASNLAACCRCGTHAWLSHDRLCRGCVGVVSGWAEALVVELGWWLERRAAFEAYYAEWQKSHA